MSGQLKSARKRMLALPRMRILLHPPERHRHGLCSPVVVVTGGGINQDGSANVGLALRTGWSAVAQKLPCGNGGGQVRLDLEQT